VKQGHPAPPWPLIVPHMFMADRSYIAGGVSGHPGGRHSANPHRPVTGGEPPLDVTLFLGRNANERDGYRAPPVIGWSSRIRRTPGHLTVPVRRVCCRLEELMQHFSLVLITAVTSATSSVAASTCGVINSRELTSPTPSNT
jgi:hypothetical protein